MARMSKKKALEQNLYKENVIRTAIYTRLSVLNNNKENNEDSIENQVDIINDYLKDKEEFKVIAKFFDNGEKGTHFDRPAFKEMLNDIYNNKIDCVIVKDLSRLGREYIQTCTYIQEIFPSYNVRFIAINNNIDTKNLDSFGNIIMNFTNFSNNIYALDISKKSAQALRTRQEQGSFTGSNAPYGFKIFKDEENNIIRLLIDEEVADNVRKIFELKADGKSYTEIITYLEDNDVISPYEYLYKKGELKKEKTKIYHWTNRTVSNLLVNEVYIGNMVQGKNKTSLCEDMKKTKQPKSNWIRVENTHEPIISKELFYQVQNILENNNKNYHNNLKYVHIEREEDIFKSKLKCDCGGNLHQRRRIRKYKCKRTGKDSEYISNLYECPTPRPAKGQPKCKFNTISSNHIKNIVLMSIQEQIQKLIDFENLMIKKKYTNEFQIKLDKNKKQIEKATKELEKVAKIKRELYNDYTEKLLTKDEYIYASTKYKDKEISLKSELVNLGEEKDILERQKAKNNKYIKNLMSFKDEKTLTKEIVDILIEEIKIHDRDDIEIIYKFNIETPIKGGK